MQEKFTINKEATELKRSRITQAHLYLMDNSQIDNKLIGIRNIPIEDHGNFNVLVLPVDA